jgi:hypothetical protein
MKRFFLYVMTIGALGLPVLLVAAIVAEHARWGPFAPPEAPLASANSPTAPPAAGAGGIDLEDYQPRRVIQRHLPPISNPSTKRARELAGEVSDDELVLGVEINGEARAYPINQLHWPQREVFNDVLGGRPIAATW